MTMLEKARLAVRRTSTSIFDKELIDLIGGACLDLGIAGVQVDTYEDTASYSAGDRCVKDGMYYVCAAKNTTGVFNIDDWAEDALIITAICTYVKCHFGETDEYEHLKASYDEQKAQMQMSRWYSDYSMLNGGGADV